MNPAQQFLNLAPDRRQIAFEQAGTIRGLHPAIIEKDFWVCWLLGILFADPALSPHVVFKGGTSLSKVYGAIDRFSEDIDLSISPAFVGADALAFEEAPSKTKREAAFEAMQTCCRDSARDRIGPHLERIVREVLAAPNTQDTCSCSRSTRSRTRRC